MADDYATPWLFDRTAKLTDAQKRARREVRTLERLVNGLADDRLKRQIVTATAALGHAEGGVPADAMRLVAGELRAAADELERSFADAVVQQLRQQIKEP
jgi:hypothetical protein